MSYWADPKPVRRDGAVAVGEMAREAVALLDEGGITALTIRALAGRLRVAPPSLHSRIESVDDLLNLALDHALERDAQVWTANDDGPTAPARLLRPSAKRPTGTTCDPAASAERNGIPPPLSDGS